MRRTDYEPPTTFCRYCGAEVETRGLSVHQADRLACPLAVGDWIYATGTDAPVQIKSFATGRRTFALTDDRGGYDVLTAKRVASRCRRRDRR